MMRYFIEQGEKKAKSQTKLAEILDTRYTTLSAVKRGKRTLTCATCIKLAKFIQEDELRVIVASNLVTEKDKKRQELFRSYLE